MVPPDDAASAARGAPALTVAAVAARLGVAPATLRTWDRRYGLGPSSRLAGSHRRYGAIDVARLMVMRRLTLDGVAPGEAARIARDTPASELDDVHSAISNVVPIAVESPSGEHLGPVTVTALVDAALALDAPRCRRLLTAGLADGADRWWVDLVAPARAALAARTVLARPGEDAHSLFDAAALAVLRDRKTAATRVAEHPSAAVVLLAPAGDGTNRLSLHALASALVERDVNARVATGPLDVRHLVELCLMARPVAVVIVSDRSRADLSLVAGLHEAIEDLDIFVGTVDEDAAQALPLRRSVHRSRTFTGLLHEVIAATGVSTQGGGAVDR
mgnify:CR=1 FL=1